MSFYDLAKNERQQLVAEVYKSILHDIETHQAEKVVAYFSDDDTYIRKAAYLAIGKIYLQHHFLHQAVLQTLGALLHHPDCKVRQTVVNAAGEIGIHDFEAVEQFFDTGLFDEHHTVRNAVVGSVKKMGARNPAPVLAWAKKYLHHPDKEVRREICHGIELRGRTHPADILPLLKELQFDQTARVRNTLVHVIGQISYKKNCLPMVISHLNCWENRAIVNAAVAEIIDVHQRYRDFAVMTQDESIAFIKVHLKK